MSIKDEIIGIEKNNKYGSLMRIVECKKDVRKIKIYFPQYDYYKYSSWQHFQEGAVKSPYCPSVFGIGYLGEGKYKAYENGKQTLYYTRWKAILNRCYYNYKDKNKTYTDICQIEDYLLNFQNFASWLDEQLKKCPFKEWYIDKDILEKGNKIYDRQHMVLVDRRLNNLFTKSEAIRGEYPIGVNYHKLKMCFEVSCSVYEDNKKKNIYLGRFSINEPFRAFTCYKNFKEKYIKQVADEYKDLIPKELYEAMYRYKVEITD